MPSSENDLTLAFQHLEELWRRVRDTPIDDAEASFSLTMRLCRENNWSAAFAIRVVAEYRKFCFLAVTQGREVTPSDEVDQAWHLHLLYTRHYWGPWTEALGTKLHHGPTKGGPAEGSRYRNNYAETLALYEDVFGYAPPSDLWPPSEERFGRAPHFRRIDTSRVVIVDRGFAIMSGIAASIFGAAGVLGFSSPGLAGEPLAMAGLDPAIVRDNWKLFTFVGLIALTCMFMAVTSFSRGHTSGRRGGHGSGGFVGTNGDSSDGGSGDGGASGCGGGGCGGCGGG
ncbi:MAG: hypothetical protein AAGH41_02390 [Pseudomonadota bacterium]